MRLFLFKDWLFLTKIELKKFAVLLVLKNGIGIDVKNVKRLTFLIVENVQKTIHFVKNNSALEFKQTCVVPITTGFIAENMVLC